MIVAVCIFCCLETVQLPTPDNLPSCAYGQWDSDVIKFLFQFSINVIHAVFDGIND